MSDTSELLRENLLGNTDFLLERARAGSQSAWRAILRRYQTMLEAHVRSVIVGISRQDVEDLLQVVLARVFLHIERFHYEGEGSFRRWLSTLVVNECKNELKARAAQANQVPTVPFDLSRLEDARGAERRELSGDLDLLLAHMGALDEADRDVLIMRYFEGLSWGAVAEVLGCSIDKAHSDYALAMERLARRLGA